MLSVCVTHTHTHISLPLDASGGSERRLLKELQVMKGDVVSLAPRTEGVSVCLRAAADLLV